MWHRWVISILFFLFFAGMFVYAILLTIRSDKKNGKDVLNLLPFNQKNAITLKDIMRRVKGPYSEDYVLYLLGTLQRKGKVSYRKKFDRFSDDSYYWRVDSPEENSEDTSSQQIGGK